MAKTKGPLMSLDAHGSFGRVLTYSHRKSGRQVRAYTKPLIEASAKQRGQRRLTEFLVAQWQNMSAGDKATWETNARLSGPNITGYHYFLREAQRDLYTHTGLVGYWHCNEIVGGKVLDLSGNANHGTLQPGYPANAPVLVDSQKTRFGKALEYDGIDEYVECLANKISGTGSIEFVTFLNNIDAPSTFVWFGVGWYFGDMVLLRFYNDTDKVHFLVYKGGVAQCDILTDVALQIHKWYSFLVTYKTNECKLFLNGVQQGVTDVNATMITDLGTKIYIGSRKNIEDFTKGIIDEVCIYNRVISPAEGTTRYKFATREVD